MFYNTLNFSRKFASRQQPIQIIDHREFDQYSPTDHRIRRPSPRILRRIHQVLRSSKTAPTKTATVPRTATKVRNTAKKVPRTGQKVPKIAKTVRNTAQTGPQTEHPRTGKERRTGRWACRILPWFAGRSPEPRRPTKGGRRTSKMAGTASLAPEARRRTSPEGPGPISSPENSFELI